MCNRTFGFSCQLIKHLLLVIDVFVKSLQTAYVSSFKPALVSFIGVCIIESTIGDLVEVVNINKLYTIIVSKSSIEH